MGVLKIYQVYRSILDICHIAHLTLHTNHTAPAETRSLCVAADQITRFIGQAIPPSLECLVDT